MGSVVVVFGRVNNTSAADIIVLLDVKYVPISTTFELFNTPVHVSSCK